MEETGKTCAVVSFLIICPIAIAYSIRQIIKPVCVCRCIICKSSGKFFKGFGGRPGHHWAPLAAPLLIA